LFGLLFSTWRRLWLVLSLDDGGVSSSGGAATPGTPTLVRLVVFCSLFSTDMEARQQHTLSGRKAP
jgi:hypothetical protein